VYDEGESMTAEAVQEGLGEHNGYRIEKTSIKVDKLGAGLSKAVEIEPIIIDVNGRAFIAVEVRKTQDKFVYLRNAATGAVESVEQMQVFDALTATFADETLVGKAITKMASRIKMQAETIAETKGQLKLRLVTDELDPEQVMRAEYQAELQALAHEAEENAGAVEEQADAVSTDDTSVQADYFGYGISMGEPGPSPDQGVDNASYLMFVNNLPEGATDGETNGD
jgi:hypothetical protein